jgi:hypothetical protein
MDEYNLLLHRFNFRPSPILEKDIVEKLKEKKKEEFEPEDAMAMLTINETSNKKRKAPLPFEEKLIKKKKNVV